MRLTASEGKMPCSTRADFQGPQELGHRTKAGQPSPWVGWPPGSRTLGEEQVCGRGT